MMKKDKNLINSKLYAKGSKLSRPQSLPSHFLTSEFHVVGWSSSL